METGNNSGYNQPYKPQKDILNKLNYSTMLCGQNNLYINAPIQNYYLFNSFLQKKRETTDNKYHLAAHVNQKESKGNYLFQIRFVILLSFFNSI